MLNRQPLSTLMATCLSVLILCINQALSAPRESVVKEIHSRELVDVEWLTDGRLLMLVSAPQTEKPGLYLFRPTSTPEYRLEHYCPLHAVSHFSFDRRHLLSRTLADGSRVLEVRRLPDCAEPLRIPSESGVLDADANHRWIVQAVRLDKQRARIELYDRDGRQQANAETDRHVELGLSPFSDRLLNFDRASKGPRAWYLPGLLATENTQVDQPTPLPGTLASKLDASSGQARLLLPEGRLLTLEARERVRAASRDGRYLLTHRAEGANERLTWIDTEQDLRQTVRFGPSGAIDHAAVRADGQAVAWTERRGDKVSLRVLVF